MASSSMRKEHLDLQADLDAAYKLYAEFNPKSLEAYKQGCEVMPGANTRSSIHAAPFPLTIVRGEASSLFSIDGHEYLDFLGEFSAGIYGHNSPIIRNAVIEALSKGWNFGTKNVYEDQLARLLLNRFSNSMELVRFCNSGTEANMMAVGTAINFTGKKKVLVFVGGYHGSTMIFLNAAPSHTMNAPYDFVVSEYNDIAGTNKLVKALPPNSLAAVLVEPMQVAGGCIIGTTEFLQYLRDLATEEDALLIFDEIMTSRLDYGGLQVPLGIKPDITTIGKWAGGGMNFGAWGARREIMNWFNPSTGKLGHSGTFNNNIVTMSAGVAGCQFMTKEVQAKLNTLGTNTFNNIRELIHKRITKSADETTGPKVFVTGYGSLFAIRFDGPDGATLRELFYHYLLRHNIHIASRGFLALSLENTEQHCRRLLGVIDQFLVQYSSALV